MADLQRVVLHDQELDVDVLITSNGELLVNTGGERTVLFAYDADSNLEYIGKASIGSTTDAAVWQIKKLAYTSGNLVSIKWHDGDTSYDNVWDSRAGGSYS